MNIDAPASYKTYTGVQVFGGWAIDSMGPIINITVEIDQAPYAMAPYGGNRQDVCNDYPNVLDCPNVGWSVIVDTSQLTNGLHSLGVWAVTQDGRRTQGSNGYSVFYVQNEYPATIAMDAPQQGQQYSGVINFSGWAVNSATPVSDVRLTIDGNPIGTVPVNIYRPDVCAAVGNVPGCPNVGFNLEFDTGSLSNGAAHFLTVTALGSFGATAQTLYFYTSNSPSTVHVDWPDNQSPMQGTTLLMGWAVDSDSPITSVNLSIDGSGYGQVGMFPRQDVCDALGNYPGCPNVGWQYNLDTTLLADGMHIATVISQTADGRQTQSSTACYVNNGILSSIVEPATGNSSNQVSCKSLNEMAYSKAGTRLSGSDGLVHLQYAFTGADGRIVISPDAVTLSAANKAITEWNNLSIYTGIQLDPLPPGQLGTNADLTIGQSSDSLQTGSCAGTSIWTNAIRFNQTAHDSTNLTFILAHEVGHVLGLDDASTEPTTPASVMNQIPPSTCGNPVPPQSTVTLSDAGLVNSCRGAEQTFFKNLGVSSQKHPPSNTTQQVTVNGGPPAPYATYCIYTYTTVDFYVDGVYDSSEDFVDGVICH